MSLANFGEQVKPVIAKAPPGAAGLALGLRIDDWLRNRALPLWAQNGFDAETGLFHESLGLDGAPNVTASRRLMVQARQISVYAAAHLAGRFPEGAELALRAMRRTITAYFGADGAPGWIFSVSPDGRPADRKRDLYAHAFALFALAWALRLEDDATFRRARDKTLDFLGEAFVDRKNGGYWDCLPRTDALRRQNPHMHLFEALMSLQKTEARNDILEICQSLHALACSRFHDLKTGALREYFNNDWSVHPGRGQGLVEPGHLFEWAWLLRRYEEISGESQDEPVQSLIGAAIRFGFTPATGRIVAGIGEDGAPRAAESRCWPHCEALKALVLETQLSKGLWTGSVQTVTERLLDHYCRADLRGGWIDCLDADDLPISKAMPASSFYHIYFGFDATLKLVGGRALPLGRTNTWVDARSWP